MVDGYLIELEPSIILNRMRNSNNGTIYYLVAFEPDHAKKIKYQPQWCPEFVLLELYKDKVIEYFRSQFI